MPATQDPTQFLRPEAAPSKLSADVIARFSEIPGFFNEDDAMHFFLILEMQSNLGFTGDILEIGSFRGRSTALLAYCLKPNETLVVNDVFEQDADGHYDNKPTISDLTQNIQKINPTFNLEQLDIHSGLSTSLELSETPRFRFSHIDGGHDADTAYHDITLAAHRTIATGVISIDDYHHPDWPGVTVAADRFLSENPSTWRVLADMNRHIAKGRKLYITIIA